MDILKGLFKEFGWFIWVLVGIGFVWFFTGGPDRASSHAGAYLKPPAPLDSGQVYGTYYDGSTKQGTETLNLPKVNVGAAVKKTENTIENFLKQAKDAQGIHALSLLSKDIALDGIAGAESSDPNQEYLRIVANVRAVSPINISGLSLKGAALGTNVLIPQASNQLVLGVPYIESDIALPPLGRVLITSGRSPVGTSFRVNICSGYLDQFQNYTPDLRKECPFPADELKQSSAYYESSCREFVEKLPRCRIYTGKVPDSLSSACKNFMTQKLNYNSCVATHKDDIGFLKDEWRVFLESKNELWQNKQEIIKLIDQKGSTLDAITF